MTMAPRDRWVGASPGGNVTPAGQALEALDAVRARCRRAVSEHQHGNTLAAELMELIASIARAPELNEPTTDDDRR
jgi:hypothetical protein